MRVHFLGQEDPLEESMATHSSILAWRIPWTEELGKLGSIGWQRVGHDWVTWHSTVQVQFSCSVMSDSLRPHALQHSRLPCPSPTPRACSNSCPSSRWCHPTISSSIVPFFSCLQSFPASGSFPRSQFFTSGGQSIKASARVLPMNIQDWFPQQSCVKEEKNWWRLFSNLYWFYIWTSSKILLVCKLKDSKDCKCLITLYIIFKAIVYILL